MLQLYLLYYNSSFLVTIIISKEEKIFYQLPTKKKMKVLTIYLLSLVFFASVGQHLATNIKESLQQRTDKIDSVLSSYSVYLQNK